MSNTSGLCIIGTIKDRRRREVTKNGEIFEIVSYEIVDDDNHTYYVEAFAPEKHFTRDEHVQIPVYIKVYTKKNGDPSYTINYRNNVVFSRSRGESF